MKRLTILFLIFIASFLLLSCNNDKIDDDDIDLSNEHNHTIEDHWSMDSEYHWHELTCEHRGELVYDKIHHFFREDKYGKFKCLICGYEKQREFELIYNAPGYDYINLETSNTIEIYVGELIRFNYYDLLNNNATIKFIPDDDNIVEVNGTEIKGLSVGETTIYPYYKALKLEDYPIIVNVIEYVVDSTNNIDSDVYELNNLYNVLTKDQNYFTIDIDSSNDNQDFELHYQMIKEPYYHYDEYYVSGWKYCNIYQEEDGFKNYYYIIDMSTNEIKRYAANIEFNDQNKTFAYDFISFSGNKMEISRDGDEYYVKGYTKDLPDDIQWDLYHHLNDGSKQIGRFNGVVKVSGNKLSFEMNYWFISYNGKRITYLITYSVDVTPFEKYDLSAFYEKTPTSIYEVTKVTPVGSDIVFPDDMMQSYNKTYFEEGIYYIEIDTKYPRPNYHYYDIELFDSNYYAFTDKVKEFLVDGEELKFMFNIKKAGYYYYAIYKRNTDDGKLKIKKYEGEIHDELQLGQNVGAISSQYDHYVFHQKLSKITNYKFTNNSDHSIYVYSDKGFKEIKANESATFSLFGNPYNICDNYIYVVSPFLNKDSDNSYSFDINIEIIEE